MQRHPQSVSPPQISPQFRTGAPFPSVSNGTESSVAPTPRTNEPSGVRDRRPSHGPRRTNFCFSGSQRLPVREVLTYMCLNKHSDTGARTRKFILNTITGVHCSAIDLWRSVPNPLLLAAILLIRMPFYKCLLREQLIYSTLTLLLWHWSRFTLHFHMRRCPLTATQTAMEIRTGSERCEQWGHLSWMCLHSNWIDLSQKSDWLSRWDRSSVCLFVTHDSSYSRLPFFSV